MTKTYFIFGVLVIIILILMITIIIQITILEAITTELRDTKRKLNRYTRKAKL